MFDMKATLARVASGDALDQETAEQTFDIIMSGDATPVQIGALLMGLRVRGETIDEISGAVKVMRSKMVRVQAPADAVDLVGTGGDSSGTYNISTCASFVVAGMGIPVAKHGNRALSSKSGAADTLMALGVNLDLTPEQISICIDKAGLGFMFAPAHHSAMKHVGPARVELGTRTIFNLLGPLSNPASVKRQMVGVFDEKWLEPLAHTLSRLGSIKAWIVHGSDGLDEITTTGPSQCAILDNGTVSRCVIEPGKLGLELAKPAELVGGDAAYNADALKRVLDGEQSAHRDIVLLNSAATAVVAGRAETLSDGLEMARASIDDGKAHSAMQALVTLSNSFGSK
uniref:anthranilate phosphoribosyltransferase n=1 Tax=Pararhizobium sp. IMCC3301 TaxID=3067904 RepID=UPI0027422046|nr:anthranilate phosphoribosyltransferase [Pararhizobium sp. IMCC3301]